jgi:hypothetical protein
MRFFENFSRWDALRFALAVILWGACSAVIFVFEASFIFGIYLAPNKMSLYKIINLLAGAFIEAISALYIYKIFIIYGVIANFAVWILTLLAKRPFLKFDIL